jgi:cbb3-type cytochrome oxidase maturation protein
VDILYLLIPLSAVLVLAIIGIFAWALHRGQFDDIDDEGRRILVDDQDVLDRHQPASIPRARESRGFALDDKTLQP